MQNDTSAATVAKRKKLEEQLAKAKADLEETQYQHSIEAQEDALNKQFEDYEATRNKEIDALRESLTNRETILAESFETVKNNADIVGQEIAQIATEHGVTVSNALISSWQSGEKAIASYGEVLSQGTSAFIGNIMGVESEMWNLQAQANYTADSLAWMFSTKADNLVNELTTSYYAESNLVNMTNALQQSLINALERGYNVNSIVNSLNSVESAARSAKAAIDAMNGSGGYSGGYSGGNNLNNTSTSSSSSSSGTKYSVRNAAGTTLTTLDYYPSQSELAALKEQYKKFMGSSIGSGPLSVVRLGTHAKGVHNLKKDEIAWTQEKGNELILSPSRNAMLTPLKQGDTVLTKEQTDRLYELSNTKSGTIPFNSLTLEAMQDMWNKARTPEPVIDRRMTTPTNVHFDSLINVEGSLNSTDVKQMEAIVDKGINKLVDKMYDGIKYRRY